MARSLDKSLRDCTGNVLPILFLFALTAYITTTLVYSNGHNLPVPGHVSAGLLSTLASLVLFYTIGRLYCYFKGPPSQVPDVERPTSSESKMHPTMAPPPPTESLGMPKDRVAALPHPAAHEQRHPRPPPTGDAAIFPTPDLPSLPPQIRPFRPFRPAAVPVQPAAPSQPRLSPTSDSSNSPITPSRIPRPLRTGLARLQHQNAHSRQASADFTVASSTMAQPTVPPGKQKIQPSPGMRGDFFQGAGHGSLPPSAPNLEHVTVVNIVELSGGNGLWTTLLRDFIVSDCCKELPRVQLLEKEGPFDHCLMMGDKASIEVCDDIGSGYSGSDAGSGTSSLSTTDSISTVELGEEEHFGRQDWASPT